MDCGGQDRNHWRQSVQEEVMGLPGWGEHLGQGHWDGRNQGSIEENKV